MVLFVLLRGGSSRIMAVFCFEGIPFRLESGFGRFLAPFLIVKLASWEPLGGNTVLVRKRLFVSTRFAARGKLFLFHPAWKASLVGPS